MIKQPNNLELLEAIKQNTAEQLADTKKELLNVITGTKSEILTVVREELQQKLGETKKELLGAIEDLAASMNTFATDTENRFSSIDGRLSSLESNVKELKSDVSSLKSDNKSIKLTMVTKDYLDEKLADLRGDLVVITRKEDAKLNTLVDVLAVKKVLTKSEQRRIMSMEPFARPAQ